MQRTVDLRVLLSGDIRGEKNVQLAGFHEFVEDVSGNSKPPSSRRVDPSGYFRHGGGNKRKRGRNLLIISISVIFILSLSA